MAPTYSHQFPVLNLSTEIFRGHIVASVDCLIVREHDAG